jgi:predicted aminopeptidase
MTRTRPVWIRDAAGGAAQSTTAGTATAAISGYLQIGSGGVALRYGRENVRFGATLYCDGSQDLKANDLLAVTIASEVRTYRVDSVRVPDDRSTADSLYHLIATLEEDLPRG